MSSPFVFLLFIHAIFYFLLLYVFKGDVEKAAKTALLMFCGSLPYALFLHGKYSVEDQLFNLRYPTTIELWEEKYETADTRFSEDEIMNSKILQRYHRKKGGGVAPCPQSLAYKVSSLGSQYFVHCFDSNGDYVVGYHIRM